MKRLAWYVGAFLLGLYTAIVWNAAGGFYVRVAP